MGARRPEKNHFTHADLDRCLAQVMLALDPSDGMPNREKAILAIDRLFAPREVTGKIDEYTHIIALGLNVRVVNLLEANGVVRIRDLTEKTRLDLLQFCDLGPKIANDIEEALRDVGYALKGYGE